jgi:hypothetical protein
VQILEVGGRKNKKLTPRLKVEVAQLLAEDGVVPPAIFEQWTGMYSFRKFNLFVIFKKSSDPLQRRFLTPQPSLVPVDGFTTLRELMVWTPTVAPYATQQDQVIKLSCAVLHRTLLALMGTLVKNVLNRDRN